MLNVLCKGISLFILFVQDSFQNHALVGQNLQHNFLHFYINQIFIQISN